MMRRQSGVGPTPFRGFQPSGVLTAWSLRQPIPGAVLHTFFEFGLLDDPAQVVGVAGGDLSVATAAVLPEMKPGIEGRLCRPLDQFSPSCALDELFKDGDCDDDIKGGPVR